MPDFRLASPGAAYVIADGVTGPEEAETFGLIVVETDALGKPTAYGRYLEPGEEIEEAKPAAKGK